MTKVLGILRARCYSPGMVERDEAILRAVVERLKTIGYTVSLIHEEDLSSETPSPDIALHMARSPRALDILQKWQERGCLVINSVEGIHNVERAAMAEQCIAQGIPIPNTWIVPTAGPIPEDIIFPCWIKRAGSCAQAPDDVCFAPDFEAYKYYISKFHTRGIHKVVVMEHIEGTCIKFYVVRGTDFFYCISSENLGYDKFSSHTPTQEADATKWNNESLSNTLRTLYSHLDFQLDIYGGDAIIGLDGVVRLIDLNDWPSFSVCREDAANAIVQLIIDKVRQKKK